MMSRMFRVAFAILIVVPLSIAQQQQDCKPTTALKAMVDKGCFSSSGSLEDQGFNEFQSPGICQCFCANLGKPVMATSGGTNCWCGDLIPASSSKVDSGKCNSECKGYRQDKCGGDKAWTVSLTGLQANVANEGDSGSSSSAQTSGSTPVTQSPDTPTPIIIETASVVTAGGPTVFVTAPGQTTPSSDPATESSTAPKPSPKPNTAGIAAGVVVGVVVLGAMLGGGYLYLRSRKRRAVEEEYRVNAAISSAAGGDKPPGSAGSMSDSRLEPSVMLQRRQSDGSIADNQDYSRRILKVTNPDGT